MDSSVPRRIPGYCAPVAGYSLYCSSGGDARSDPVPIVMLNWMNYDERVKT